MNYVKREWKKLGSISLIGIGAFLLIEHIYSYGGIDLLDFLGHEWIGIILVILGVIGANRKWREKLSPIQYAIKKLRRSN